MVADIEDRTAAWTFLPPENGEPIQVLPYEHGQKYEPHSDYFVDEFNQKVGGNRIATVLMYLSDVKKGGETMFPKLEIQGVRKFCIPGRDDSIKNLGVGGALQWVVPSVFLLKVPSALLSNMKRDLL